MTPSTPVDTSEHAWRRARLCSAVLGVIAYINVPWNGFCYDDRLLVEQSSRVNTDRPWGEIWLTDYWSEARPESPKRDLLYRPISISSFRLVRQIAGPSPAAQHTLNVLLHAMTCLGVVALSRRLSLPPVAGFVGGALFAVLPIHTDVVANAVGRCDLLSAWGTIAAILLCLRAGDCETPSARVSLCAAASLASFFAMGSKENALATVALIPLVTGCVVSNRGGSPAPDRPAPTSRIGKQHDGAIHHAVIPWARSLAIALPPLITYTGLRYVALGHRLVQEPPISRSVNVLVDAPVWQHALGVTQLWGMYWAKTLWPETLTIGYSINTMHLATSVADPHVLLGAAILLMMAVASTRALRLGDRRPIMLAVCIVVAYLPTANAIVPLQVFFAERIWYGPSIWVVLLAGSFLGGLELEGWSKVTRTACCVSAWMLLCAMLVRCWTRNADWRNEGRLLAAAVRDQPTGVAPLQLYGQYLVNERMFAEAVPVLERAVRVDLGYTDAYVSLAQAQLGLGHFDDALRSLAIAQQQFPGHPRVPAMVAQAQAALSDAADAELGPLRARIRERPGDLEAELALVRSLRRWGRGTEAIDRLDGAEALLERAPAWRYERAVTLASAGRRDEAIAAYLRLLEIDESNAQARVELAMLLLERRSPGDIELADDALRPAEASAPTSANVLVARAEWFAARGQVHEAISAYRRALSTLAPTSPRRPLFEQRMRSLGG